MSKYIFKKNIDVNQYNLSEVALRVGISRQTLSRILNYRQPTNKPYAYAITKILNSEKEIAYFFEII